MKPAPEYRRRIEEAAAERNQRDLKRVYARQKKADDLAGQSDEKILEGLNSWRSFSQRASRDARKLGTDLESPRIYKNAMKLLGHIRKRFRSNNEQPVMIPVVWMKQRTGYASDTYIGMLLRLLRGLNVKDGKQTFIGIKCEGHPLVLVRNGGRNSDFYVVNKPQHGEDETLYPWEGWG